MRLARSGRRRRSIRLRMLAIVLIPSAALLVIGVGASGYLVYQGYNAQEWATTMQATVAPGTQLASLVEEERRLSLLHLGGDKKAAPELAKQRTELERAPCLPRQITTPGHACHAEFRRASARP